MRDLSSSRKITQINQQALLSIQVHPDLNMATATALSASTSKRKGFRNGRERRREMVPSKSSEARKIELAIDAEVASMGPLNGRGGPTRDRTEGFEAIITSRDHIEIIRDRDRRTKGVVLNLFYKSDAKAESSSGFT